MGPTSAGGSRAQLDERRSDGPSPWLGGGSGGLDSIRARVLACIAARDYDQAREYLKLAANMTEEEQARFEQMISAAERGLVPFLEKALPHIFKADPGHFAEDTAEARELIQTTVTEGNFVGVSSRGNHVYARLLETGKQIWVYVWNGNHPRRRAQ